MPPPSNGFNLPFAYNGLPPTDYTHSRNLWLKPQPELMTLKPGDKVITTNACIGYKIEGNEDSYVQTTKGAQFDVAEGGAINLNKGQILIRGGAEAVSVNTATASSIIPAQAIALVEASSVVPTRITLLDDPSQIGTLIFANGNTYMLRKGERLVAFVPSPTSQAPNGSGVRINSASHANAPTPIASLPAQRNKRRKTNTTQVAHNTPRYYPSPVGVRNSQMPGVVSYGYVRHPANNGTTVANAQGRQNSQQAKNQLPPNVVANNAAAGQGNLLNRQANQATTVANADNIDAETRAKIKQLVETEQPHPGELNGSAQASGANGAWNSGLTVGTTSVPLERVIASSDLVQCSAPRIRHQLGVHGAGSGGGPKNEGIAEKYKGARTSLPHPVQPVAPVAWLPLPALPVMPVADNSTANPQPKSLNVQAENPMPQSPVASNDGWQLPALPLSANYGTRRGPDVSAIYAAVARYQSVPMPMPMPAPQTIGASVPDAAEVAAAFKQALDTGMTDSSHYQAVAWQAPAVSPATGFGTADGDGLVRVSNGVYKLDSGDAFITPAEASRVDVPGASVFIGGHNCVFISVERRITRIMDLNDTTAKSVRVVYKQHLLPLYPGSELSIVDADQQRAGDIIMSDGIGRREMRILAFEDSSFVVIDDFSLTNAISNIPRLSDLYRSQSKEDRAYVASILKMAAILSYMYDPVKGPFTAATIPARGLAETLNMQTW